MAIIKCKMCGGDIQLAEDKTFGTCEYCGSAMTLPRVSDEQRAAAFNRGNHFRRAGEFDKALSVYEHIVADDDTDAEAHWCCALCRFGIEYVEDPATYEWLPTCHRASFDSFLEDVDYLAALEHSDGITRRQYQKDAAKIAEVQRGILAASQNTEPYDVFISYKELDGNGERTRDSILAQEIYYRLTEKGWRVFFSRISLEDVPGTQYEPYIFAALNSAKVMVVVGTSAENFNAVWVKNEWSRFLAMMRKDRSKLLIPCYRDMDPYDLPEQLSVLMSYDMGRIGFIQDLIRGVDKVLGAEKKEEVVKETVVVQQSGGPNVTALLKRGQQALEDGEWDKAKDFFDQVLSMDAENAEAFFGLFLAGAKCADADTYIHRAVEQKGCTETLNISPASDWIEAAIKANTVPGYLPADEIQKLFAFDLSYPSTASSQASIAQQEKAKIESNRNLNRAFRFASSDKSGSMSSFKASFLTSLEGSVEEAQAQAEAARKAKEDAYKVFLAKAETKAIELRQAAEEKREADYQAACEAQQNGNTIGDFITAIGLYDRLHAYKDSADRIRECRERIDDLTELARKEKLYKTCQRIFTGSVSNELKNWRAAREGFESLGDYKDSRECAQKCAEMLDRMIAAKEAEAKTAAEEAERRRIAADKEAERQQIEMERTERLRAARKKRITFAVVIGVVLTVSACCIYMKVIVPSNNYKAAEAMYTAGKYEEAIVAFESLGGYKDSVTRIEEAHESIRARDYAAAQELFEAGQYEEAIKVYQALGKYKDSAARIEEAQDAIHAQDYAAAEALLADGDKAKAAIAFCKLDGYKDARIRGLALWNEIAQRDTIAAGLWHTVGLKVSGSVIAAGSNHDSQCNVSDWTDIVAIAAGSSHTVGLKADGSVVATGKNDYGECNVSGWKNIVAIAAGNLHTVGLKVDGSVVAVGWNKHGECDVSDWTDIIAVAAGEYNTVGLKADGSVVAVGDNQSGKCDVSGWTDIVAVALGEWHTVGLTVDNKVISVGSNGNGQCDVSGWHDIAAVATGGTHTVGLKMDGRVVAAGWNGDGQCNVSGWHDIVAIATGYAHTVGLKADGSVIAVGNNGDGRCEVSGWKNIKLPNR